MLENKQQQPPQRGKAKQIEWTFAAEELEPEVRLLRTLRPLEGARAPPIARGPRAGFEGALPAPDPGRVDVPGPCPQGTRIFNGMRLCEL